MELFDRQIIAATIAQSLTLKLTHSCLQQAPARIRQGDHPIVHSDQGFQYQHRS
ncbi:hypothetical protein [Cutibacterium equinum]|uniref:hypothetical protein n=1 Tax=Cutibacterium equinum TaxID=3016342 RepID=UPI0038CDC194